MRLVVARVGRAHGIRGEVKLKSFTADPLAVKDYGALESEDGAASFEIEALRSAKGYLVARLRGVRDRNAAEQLTNLRLFVPRERLGGTEADEYFHADLIGLMAVTVAGASLGTVIRVENYGAGDLLEIAPRRGETLLVLDAVTGGDAARLYDHLGWTTVGVVPNFALYPDGRPCDTTYFWKAL